MAAIKILGMSYTSYRISTNFSKELFTFSNIICKLCNPHFASLTDKKRLDFKYV